MADADGTRCIVTFLLLSFLGSSLPAQSPSDVQDMIFQNDLVTVASVDVTLDGEFIVTEGGESFQGAVVVSYGAGGEATLLAEQGPSFTVLIGLDVVDMNSADPDVILVNGSPMSSASAVDSFALDLASGLDPSIWSLVGQAVLVITALGESDPWESNIAVVRQLSFFSSTFWCKAAVIAGTAAVVALGTAGCAVLLAGCAAATTVTIGGMAIPCAVLQGLCAGGVYGWM